MSSRGETALSFTVSISRVEGPLVAQGLPPNPDRLPFGSNPIPFFTSETTRCDHVVILALH